ncbi:PSP1-domain-containing protein [Xylona heveae TC161]|uniref:PSP1-domain-containing protein n=1 Tax=Xylona heveae (strain CBS 132557 / TC161) TaxID=1328760 RepID=A0A165A5L2_XYLHT|nr:PSP1-domain-containing protein [Xylona heveae TC161]KZF19984.1 PSP1-domain-containing protein [Xylona heveae TC161]
MPLIMASSAGTSAHMDKSITSTSSAMNGGGSSSLLEKAKTGHRRSTPDSEALASSEDEQDNSLRLRRFSTTAAAKPPRRASWLNDVQPISQRKSSLVSTSSFVPSSPQSNASAGDASLWGAGINAAPTSTLGRAARNSTSFSWGSNIWNDARKEPPSRLTEVLPISNSPSTLHEESNTGTLPRAPEESIPFAIPLHPTPKTYRSQSYSVGQMDPESPSSTIPGTFFPGNRPRPFQPPGLQHRSSRPSVLGDAPHDGSSLGRLREVDDDYESTNGSEEGVQLSAQHARSIAYENEQLAIQNALLRQQVAATQSGRAHPRERSLSGVSAMNGLSPNGSKSRNAFGLPEDLKEEADFAVDEADDVRTHDNKGHAGRRFSEFSAAPEARFPTYRMPENRQLENLKKTHWQSSLDFGGLPDIPQSRRHSFAEVPSRHSLVNQPTDQLGNDLGLALADKLEASSRTGSGTGQQGHAEIASYFSGLLPTTTNGGTAFPESYAQAHTGSRNLYGLPQHLALSQPHQNQLLYVVTFKCCRADIFYIQEGTGLQVKPGDLVIVEADRGTDLGTVAHDNVTWAKAKEYKEYYAEEHYKWLMMFSRQGQTASAAGALPGSGGSHGSAIGGMGPPPHGHHTMPDTITSEIKPKMIKRLAQNHEIQTLRDKEGNEAKAKRVCQQKVVEHRLNMEILDAEFQMDWKKLTFYYFADSYINFNSLVTDLFKVYKTRIWMSAINPASFATPSAGLQPPNGIGPGALASSRDQSLDGRGQRDQSGYTTLLGSYRNYFTPSSEPGKNGNQSQATAFQNLYSTPSQVSGAAGRSAGSSLQDYQSPQHTLAPSASFGPIGYGGFGANQSDIPANGAQFRKGLPLGNEWVTGFQGLSLDSH